jgi:hypothetical protein
MGATAAWWASPSRPPAPLQPVWPHQALRVARQGAAAFAAHGERRRLIAVALVAVFLLGGGRQRGRAALTLWRVWPRWAVPVIMLALLAVMSAVAWANAPLGVLVATFVVLTACAAAGWVRALQSWVGVPVGSVLIADVASAGPPGEGRALLDEVCAVADRRLWTLSIRVLAERPKLLALYGELGFVACGERRRGLQLMLRSPSSPRRR